MRDLVRKAIKELLKRLSQLEQRLLAHFSPDLDRCKGLQESPLGESTRQMQRFLEYQVHLLMELISGASLFVTLAEHCRA